MRRITAILVLGAMGSTAFADPAAEIRNYHAALSKAYLAGKAEPAVKLAGATVTPDFIYFDGNGRRVNKAQYLEQIREQLATSKFSKHSYKVADPTKSPAGLEVVASMEFALKRKGTDGKMHTLTGVIVTDQSWTLIGKTPKCRRIRVRSTSVSVDGKPPVRTGGGPRVRVGIAN